MMYPLVFVAILFTLLYFYFTRTFNYWKSRNVAGPKPLPFFGNIKDSVLRRKPLPIIYKSIYDAYPKEKVVGIYRMTTPSVLLRDLDVIKNIMIKDFDLFTDRGIEFDDKGLGANIFHADGDRWRIIRNRFTPLFTSGKLKNMLYLMTERGDKFMEYVTELQEKQTEQPVHILIQKYTIGAIAACAFGVDLDDEMMKTFQKMDKMIFTANYSTEVDMMYPGILKKFGGSLFPQQIIDFFLSLVQNVIKQRGGKPSNRKDFMDLILELRQQKTIEGTKRYEHEDQTSLELTDSIIAAQAFAFYAAGYESSASTMSYMLYEMAKNPTIQDKVILEIDEVLKRHNGEINYDCLNEMTYLDHVFDETLRKYPIADPIQRNANSDYKVPGTDIIIKKGQTVVISCWGIQRDPNYYPDPDKFDPERFSPENVKNRHICSYLPFGTGPRNCIGMRFAKMQSRVCIVKLLSKFRVEPSKKTPLKEFDYDPVRLFVFPNEGIYLNIIRR